MKRVPTFLAAAVLSLGLAGGACADPIFDNGMPLMNDGGSEVSRWVEAQDFRFATAATVTGASVYIQSADLLPNAQPFNGSFEYWLFADDGGQPGETLANGFANAAVTEIGPWDYSYSTSDILRLDVDFNTAFAAAGGQTYWFGFHLNSDYTRDHLYWAWSETVRDAWGEYVFGNGHSSLLGTLDNWENNEWEHAFQLHGTAAAVPEPGAWALMIIGFGGAGAALRNRRRTALA